MSYTAVNAYEVDTLSANKDVVVGKSLVKTTSTPVVTTSGAANIDCSLGDDFTITPTEAATLTPINIKPGQEISIIFLTSGATSYTTTFGSPFHATGTLASGVTTARYFVLKFKATGDGAALLEVSRTAAFA